jgi:hypothetical protein
VVKEGQILYDARGKKTHIVLPIKTYEEMLESLEDAEDIRAIRAVLHERTIPWAEIKTQLQKKR